MTSRLPPADPRATQQLAEEVTAARLRLLFERNTPSLLIGMGFACGLGLFLWPQVPHLHLSMWLGAKLLFAGTRLLCVYSWRYKPGVRSARQWLTLHTWLLAGDGLVWGLMLMALIQPSDSMLMAMGVACLFGLGALGAVVLSHDFASTFAFVGALLLPNVAVELYREDTLHLFFAFCLLTYLLVLLLDARRVSRDMTELLTLRYTAGRLAAARAEALLRAEHASEIKTSFLATMSHEMRTPLHAMLGMLEIARQQPQVSVGEEEVKLIENSGKHLLTIINDVLDLSLIESGALKLNQRPLDIENLVRETVALMQPAGNPRLRLRHFSELGEAVWMLGDEDRVRQILINLLGNAVKFSRFGEVRLETRVVGKSLEFMVRDTGIGVAPEAREKIFEPFAQLDSANSRRFGGAGLGLSVSRELARAMGGELACIEPTDGKGAAFVLQLPWQPLSPTVIPSPSLPPAPVAPRPLVAHVLLVDDYEANLTVGAALLRTLGMRVSVAHDGAEAVEKTLALAPDLVLMDIALPTMDGLEATRRIRAEEKIRGLPPVPIVAVSASAFAADREKCLAVGMNGHLAKPFSREALEASLRDALGHPPAAQPGVGGPDGAA